MKYLGTFRPAKNIVQGSKNIYGTDVRAPAESGWENVVFSVWHLRGCDVSRGPLWLHEPSNSQFPALESSRLPGHYLDTEQIWTAWPEQWPRFPVYDT